MLRAESLLAVSVVGMTTGVRAVPTRAAKTGARSRLGFTHALAMLPDCECWLLFRMELPDFFALLAIVRV